MHDLPPWSPPQDPRPPFRNGYHAWPPPSQGTDIYLRIAEDLGALKAGMRQSLNNDAEIFGQIHEIRDRVRVLEVRPSPPATPHQPAPHTGLTPTARPGLLSGLTSMLTAVKELLIALRELLPGIKELVVIGIVIAISTKAMTIPDQLLALLGLAK